jgi:phosphatidate cytidylyltransferase
MSPSPRELFLDYEHAFDQPFVWGAAAGVCAGLLIAPVVVQWRSHGMVGWRRYRSWLALVLGLMIPLLLGVGPMIIAVGVISLWSYRDYARGTGLFREKLISMAVVLAIVAVTVAALDNWFALGVAVTPLAIGVLGAVGLLVDRPKGYVQRVGLGVLAVVLFGACLGHIGFLANHTPFRPLVGWFLLSSLVHPLFASLTRRLPGPVPFPHTIPGRTITSISCALLLTTTGAVLLGFAAFQGTGLGVPGRVVLLGVIVGFACEFSDLMLAAVRRDLNIPEPEIGRLLDHVDGLILAAPAVYWYLSYLGEIDAGRAQRLLSGG